MTEPIILVGHLSQSVTILVGGFKNSYVCCHVHFVRFQHKLPELDWSMAGGGVRERERGGGGGVKEESSLYSASRISILDLGMVATYYLLKKLTNN